MKIETTDKIGFNLENGRTVSLECLKNGEEDVYYLKVFSYHGVNLKTNFIKNPQVLEFSRQGRWMTKAVIIGDKISEDELEMIETSLPKLSCRYS